MKPLMKRNDEEQRYEHDIDGHQAKIDFKHNPQSKRIYFVHTEVPEELRNQGIAEQLVKWALEDVKSQGWDLMPLCPYVVTYLRRHPEWVEIVDESKRGQFL